MRALTLWQPWAWAIAAGHKRIENRTWRPPRGIVGQRLAIHAGKTFDKSGLCQIRSLIGGARVDEVAMHALGVVAVATVYGCVDYSLGDLLLHPAMIGQELWFFGPYGWLLADVVAIEPVPCSGAQGLWTLAPVVEHQVVERAAMKGGG